MKCEIYRTVAIKLVKAFDFVFIPDKLEFEVHVLVDWITLVSG